MKRFDVSCLALVAGVFIIEMTGGSLTAVQDNSDSSANESLPSAAEAKNGGGDENCLHPELRDELARRVQTDQLARNEMIEAMSNQQPAVNNESLESQNKLLPIIEKVEKIDRQNREWLKQQIDTHGWPGKSNVGTSGAHNAWLLVQHADGDLNFQKRCLELMTSAGKSEVSPVDIAYLTDRILAAEGKPQRYGTQCVFEDGKPVAKDVEDRENLDKRRQELGLEPMDRYLKQIAEVYGVQKSPDKEK